MPDDAQLLRQYLRDRSQAAFTELVGRHVNLVYFTALRRVGGDRHLADDVTQRVFADLARKAESLQQRPALAGWLYTSARYAAAQAVRAEQRQRTHLTEAHDMQQLQADREADWERLKPVIDEAMDELNEAEREAVLLRYFENRPFAEVGSRFSLSSDAARMRVDRALGKLRSLLVKRGITSTAAALAAIFAGQSGMAAPAGLVTRVVAGVLARGAEGGAVTAAGGALWKIMAVGAAAALGIGLATYMGSTRPETALAARTGVAEGVSTARAAQSGAHATEAVGLPPPVGPGIAGRKSTTIEKAPRAMPAPAGSSVEGEAGAEGYAGLPIRQKNILKRLWELQKVTLVEPPVHLGITVRPEATGFADIQAAIDALRARGLVAIGATKGVVFLTVRGRVFCADHVDEIEAYTLNPKRTPADGEAGETR